MITPFEKSQIIGMYQNQGMSMSDIARELNLSVTTVSKYVGISNEQKRQLLEQKPDATSKEINEAIMQALLQKPKYDASNRKPTKMTEEVVQLIEECLEENERKRRMGLGKQTMKRIDIWEYLTKEYHLDISYSTVKRKINELLSQKKEAFIRQEYSPGDACEFDWGTVKLKIDGKYRKFQMAVFTVSRSNYRFAKLYHRQDTAAFQESHVDFFEHVGAVFREVVYDNMKTAVAKFVGKEKEPTEALMQLSLYYGFSYRFCNIASGNEKPRVERSVEYIRRKTFSHPGADVFNSLEEANIALQKKCAELNAQGLTTNGEIPDEVIKVEKEHALPVPPPLSCYVRSTGRVDKYSTVAVDRNHYSVPDCMVGKDVIVHLHTSRVKIYSAADSSLLADHERSFEKRKWKIDIYHYLSTLKTKPGALKGSTAMLQMDTQLFNIYETYYINNPKEFLDVLPLARARGPQSVLNALRELDRLNVRDKSADKVAEMCRHLEDKTEYGEDAVSRRTEAQLEQYNSLMRTPDESKEEDHDD